MGQSARIGGLLLAGLLSGLLACQGARPTVEPAARRTVAPGNTPLMPTTASGQGGLTGQVVAASDVTGQPDQPLRGQMVLAVPVNKAPEVLGRGSDALSDRVLRFLKADLPRADPAIAVTLSDAAGNYTLRLDPGEYILCVADSERTPPDFPATTRGCGRTQVLPGELPRVDVSSGFGEILLIKR